MRHAAHAYGKMLADPVRTSAYARAIEQLVQPGSVVIDAGSGLGVWAMLAARAGARKVYAIDPNPNLRLARQMAADNGMDDTIEFLEQSIEDVVLAEPADGIISDLRGRLPLTRGLPLVRQAYQNLVKPGGWSLPDRDQLRVRTVENFSQYDSIASVWQNQRLGLDLSRARPFALNRLHSYVSDPMQRCGPSLDLGSIPYRALPSTAHFQGRADYLEEREFCIHGLVLFFEATLALGCSYTTDPLEDQHQRVHAYGDLFLPLERPLQVSPGSSVQVNFRADWDGQNYHYSWRCQNKDSHAEGSTLRGQAQFLPPA